MSELLLRAWEKTVRRHGDARALTHAADGRSWTFAELDAAASAWRARHVPAPRELRGRPVVFAVPNGAEWFEIFIGLLQVGAVAVPLDAAEPAAGQREIAEALRAACWWEADRLVPRPGARRYRDADVCLIKLTSGSTGRPRPLVFTAAQMLADARQVTATMGIRPPDVNYALIPLGHSYGLGNLALPLVAHGVPLVCGSAPLPQAIAADLARWRPTVFPSVPAVFRALAISEVAPAALASLRLIISAGAPLAADVAQAFVARFGRRLHSFYGSSETGGMTFDRTGNATLAGGVGRPLRGVHVTPLAARRIQVASAAVITHGNRRRAGKFGAWIPPDRVSGNGRRGLWLLGRRGATVKIAGRRVSLAEIAARLRRIRGVSDAWVAIDDAREPTLGAALAGVSSVDDVRAALRANTAAWKIPKRWAMLAEFPLTARGKPDVRILRQRLFGAGKPGTND